MKSMTVKQLCGQDNKSKKGAKWPPFENCKLESLNI